MLKLTVIPADEITKEDWTHFTQNASIWYATPGHCLLYSYFPSEKIALWRSEAGDPVAVCFFSASDSIGIGKKLILGGPSLASWKMLKELLKHEKARLLVMPWVDSREKILRLPLWRGYFWHSDSEWIADLQTDFMAYMHSLGKTTRRHLTAYERKLNSEFHSDFVVYEKEEITEQLIREFVELHRFRFANAGKVYYWKEGEIKRRTQHARECGIFCGRVREGRLIAGTLNYLHRQTVYLSLVAHDPQYDRLHCGLVCIMDTIKHLLSRGISIYNLHFHHSPFKTRMGGKENKLYKVVVFADLAAAAVYYSNRAVRRGI